MGQATGQRRRRLGRAGEQHSRQRSNPPVTSGWRCFRTVCCCCLKTESEEIASWKRLSASMPTSTSRRAKMPGWKPSRCRTPLFPITIGTSGSPPNAMRPTPPRGSWTKAAESGKSSTTTPRSASISARPCCPGWSAFRPTSIRPFWPPTVRAGNVSPDTARPWPRLTTT